MIDLHGKHTDGEIEYKSLYKQLIGKVEQIHINQVGAVHREEPKNNDKQFEELVEAVNKAAAVIDADAKKDAQESKTFIDQIIQMVSGFGKKSQPKIGRAHV